MVLVVKILMTLVVVAVRMDLALVVKILMIVVVEWW